MNSLTLLTKIADTSATIKSFSFHKFPKQQFVQDDSNICWGENEQIMFDKAIEFKKKGIPFWSGVMLSTFDNQNYSEILLEKALHHNSHPILTYVPKEKLSQWIEEQGQAVNCYALCSKIVMIDDEELHLPLLDFHIPVSDTNVRVVENVCKVIGLFSGWILNSGESYHFIGEKPICYNDMEQILYKAIMFSPIIDIAWISHQLRERSCSLRIGKKNNVFPKVIMKL